jgi:hybrid cluster-associated redox disulfide protein
MPSALPTPVTAQTILDDLMRAHGETIPLFLRRGMMCVGCPVVALHDLREACAEHGVPLEEFLSEVRGAIAAGGD